MPKVAFQKSYSWQTKTRNAVIAEDALFQLRKSELFGTGDYAKCY